MVEGDDLVVLCDDLAAVDGSLPHSYSSTEVAGLHNSHTERRRSRPHQRCIALRPLRSDRVFGLPSVARHARLGAGNVLTGSEPRSSSCESRRYCRLLQLRHELGFTCSADEAILLRMGAFGGRVSKKAPAPAPAAPPPRLLLLLALLPPPQPKQPILLSGCCPPVPGARNCSTFFLAEAPFSSLRIGKLQGRMSRDGLA